MTAVFWNGLDQFMTQIPRQFRNQIENMLIKPMYRCLDIIDIDFLQPLPIGHQTENHLMNHQYCWVRAGRAGWNDAINALDNVTSSLWLNNLSSYYGLHDHVSEAEANTLASSLLLIGPLNLTLDVGSEGGKYGPLKRRVRAKFRHNNFDYNLVVTDPVIETKYFALKDGQYGIETAILCISLAQMWKNTAYKLVASIITPNM